MHGMLITFKSLASLDEVAQPFKEYAEALCEVPGLISKTWISDGAGRLGGFHVFESRADANTYLGGELAASLVDNPAFHEFQIDHFDVIDELSVTTGTPTAQLVSIG